MRESVGTYLFREIDEHGEGPVLMMSIYIERSFFFHTKRYTQYQDMCLFSFGFVGHRW